MEPQNTEADGCTGRLVEYDDEPNCFTIYEQQGDDRRLTTWLSAREGSYVDLTDWQ